MLQISYVFLLLMDMTDLEPDVFFVQRTWGIVNNILETLLLLAMVICASFHVAPLDSVGIFVVVCRLCRA